METIINRLIVQGTRTIIDQTDYGTGVVPINSRYDGFMDCARSIAQEEGMFGFYKGVGNLIFEMMFQYALFKMARIIAIRIYDAEWTARCDKNNISNLMSSATITMTTPGDMVYKTNEQQAKPPET
jgi:hypothetical protein